MSIIGVFGGTFNPVHNGHIRLAQEFFNKFEHSRMLVIPTNVPPHKAAPDLASSRQRLDMCRIAFSKFDNVTVSDMEIKRSGLSYTADTVAELAQLYPDGELYLIMGSDMLTTFLTWYRPQEILKRAVLCAAAREHNIDERMKRAIAEIENAGGRVILLDFDPVVISSTQIRAAVKTSQDTEEYIPSGVYKYIRENGLYGCGRGQKAEEDKKLEKCKTAHENGYPIEEYKQILKKRLTEKRYHHCLCVMKEAVRLAEKYGADVQKAQAIGLLHDITKDMSVDEQLQYIKDNAIIMDSISASSPKLWHAVTGAHFIENQLNIHDEDMLNAVRYHTTARADMSLLERVLYLADYTSEERDYNGVEDMRRDVDISMERAMHTALQFSIIDLCQRDLTIHPDTVDAWNCLMKK